MVNVYGFHVGKNTIHWVFRLGFLCISNCIPSTFWEYHNAAAYHVREIYVCIYMFRSYIAVPTCIGTWSMEINGWYILSWYMFPLYTCCLWDQNLEPSIQLAIRGPKHLRLYTTGKDPQGCAVHFNGTNQLDHVPHNLNVEGLVHQRPCEARCLGTQNPRDPNHLQKGAVNIRDIWTHSDGKSSTFQRVRSDRGTRDP